MSFSCPHCGADSIPFAVPSEVRAHADGDAMALCSRCLRTYTAETGPADPDFSSVISAFPDGKAGAALAVAVGMLGSLALNRPKIVACCEYAETEGADVLLTLDRLASSGSVEPHFNIDRRRPQLANFL